MTTDKLTSQDRPKLRTYLMGRFDLEELKTLASDLGINYRDIPHGTQLEFARDLISYCERGEQLIELIEMALSWQGRSDPEIVRLLQRLKLLPTSSSFSASQPTSAIGPLLTELEQKEQAHDWDGAIETGEYILSIDSGHRPARQKTANAYLYRGNSFRQVQDNEQAISDYTKAIKYNPSLKYAYNNRGFTYNLLTQYQQAIDDLSRAIRLDPNYALAFNNRAHAYLRLGQDSLGAKDYLQASRLETNYAANLNEETITLAQANKNQQVIGDCSLAIELDPNDVAAYHQRAAAYSVLGQYQQAIADFTLAIKINPNYISAYNNRGLTYEAIKDKEAARRDYQKAADLGDEKAKAALIRLG